MWHLADQTTYTDCHNSLAIRMFYVMQILGLVHMFWFSTSWQVPITAGQSSGTQESIGIFTQPTFGWLPGSTRSYPLLCPVTGR